MLTCLSLILLWVLIWLCHLNTLPEYRRKNPFHLPQPGPVQRGFCRIAPLAGLALACWHSGLDGLFLWAFIAPVTGLLTGLIVPLLAPSPRRIPRPDGSPRP